MTNKVNIKEFFATCGMDEDDQERCSKIVHIMMDGDKNSPASCGSILLAVGAFVVEIVRRGNRQ